MRLYDYLAAGLPIIIDSEHTLMANIVTSNNFGITIPIKDVKNIINYVNKCDYDSLISSVNKNRKKYFAKTNINKLVAFFDK